MNDILLFKSNIEKTTSLISFYLFCISILLGNNEYVSLMGVFLSLPYLAKIFKTWIVNKYFVFLLFFLIVGASVNSIFTSNGFGGILLILGVLSISIFIIQNIDYIFLHVKYTLLFILLYYSIIIFIFKKDPNEVYVGMSRNYIGLIVVLFNVLYSYLYYIKSKKIDLIFCIYSLFLTFFLVGRSSIGLQLFLVLINFFYSFKNRRILMFFILFIMLLIGYCYFRDDIELLYRASSFGGYGMDSPRYVIWKDFFDSASYYDYVFGLDSKLLLVARKYSGNLHNEFLNLVARTGVGAIALFIVLCCSCFKLIYNRNFYLFSLCMISSARIFFDTGVFLNNLGIAYYSILLYPLYKNFKSFTYESTNSNVDYE